MSFHPRADIWVNAHFFTESEIELSVGPELITDQGSLDLLIGFISAVGRTLARDVVLTYENDPQNVILRYLSARDEVVAPLD